jgi:hypothetical protein
MAENQSSESEVLKEARRTTHAVRAIARFVLLIVTYQVFATIAIAFGVGVTSASGGEGAIFFIAIGVVISIAGLLHALTAGYDELGLSDREDSAPASDALPAKSEPEPSARELLPGVCSCKKLVRFANTATKDGVKYCMYCERAVPK